MCPGAPRRTSSLPPLRAFADSNIVALRKLREHRAADEVLSAVKPGFRVLSGDDAFTFPLMALEKGSHLHLLESDSGADGETYPSHAGGQNRRGTPTPFPTPAPHASELYRNQSPRQAGLAMMGMIEEVYRLPMVPMKPENRASWKRCWPRKVCCSRRRCKWKETSPYLKFYRFLFNTRRRQGRRRGSGALRAVGIPRLAASFTAQFR